MSEPREIWDRVTGGQLEEAVTLWNTRQSAWSSAQKIEARFYLGVGFCRHQEFRKGRAFFMANRRARCRDVAAKTKHRSEFFRAQGYAFHSFYVGCFRRAGLAGRSALAAAVAAGDPGFQTLALDLLGNISVQNGELRRGIRQLRRAHTLARHGKEPTFAEAIEVSILLFEAQFGMRGPIVTEAALVAKIVALKLQDSYSLVNLHLELIRCRTLMGKWEQAEQSLHEALALCSQYDNPKHLIALKLRWAELEYRRGRDSSALLHVTTLRDVVKGLGSRSLEAQIVGLEAKIVEQLAPDSFQHKLLKKRVRELSSSDSGDWPRRLASFLPNVEDPISGYRQVLRDESVPSARKLEVVCESGWLSFVVEAAGLSRGTEAVLFHPDNAAVTIVGRRGVRHIPALRAGTSRKILLRLAQGPTSKKELIESVWGYAYDADRHDAMLYGAIQQARRILDPLGDAIVSMGTHYEMRPGIEVRIPQGRVVPPARRILGNIDTRLTWRQNRLLKLLNSRQALSPAELRKSLKISRNTITRDLNGLQKLGLVRALGRNRSRKFVAVGVP